MTTMASVGTEFHICPTTGQALIPRALHAQLFDEESGGSLMQRKAAQANLREAGLPVPAPPLQAIPLAPTLPTRKGGSMLAHLTQCAEEAAGTWLAQAKMLARAKLPKRPDIEELVLQSGWMRYAPGESPQPVVTPLESALVFDTETMVRLGNTAVMAAAVSPSAWYVWLHPCLADTATTGTKRAHFDARLVPLGGSKLVVGHYVGFDRARTREEYVLDDIPNVWLDTMAMHYACDGLSNQQRKMHVAVSAQYQQGEIPDWVPDWYDAGAMANLVDCYNHHLKPAAPLGEGTKALRDIFVVAGDVEEVYRQRFVLIDYNLRDVGYTAELFQVLLPRYLVANSSPISFMGACVMGSYILPVAANWKLWVQETEMLYHQLDQAISKELNVLARATHNAWLQGALDVTKDPSLCHMDWTPAKSGKTKGHAAWFRKLKGNISTRTRVTPYLLRMTWQGKPLIFSNQFGWIYLAEDGILTTPLGKANRVPHKKGDNVNCGCPLAKDYLDSVEKGVLGSSHPDCKALLERAASISYWLSVRSRVTESLVFPATYDTDEGERRALAILPQQVTHGTVTRRAIEPLWLTVCSAKKTRVGSELKSRVQPPPGMALLQADFDAQELRLGALLGDAEHGFHGATPMAYFNLSGSKERQDDAHYMLARLLGVSRDEAKTLNYAMLYGAGNTGLARYIKMAHKEWTETKCREIAKKALEARRGKKVYLDARTGQALTKAAAKRQKTNVAELWVGGTDSSAYNRIERLANAPLPTSPLLGSHISHALRPSVVHNDFMTSRSNWLIQTSGVDLLHCWHTGFRWLCLQDGLAARAIFSFHDEVIVLTPVGTEAHAARLMQTAHIWAWALATEQLGITDLPAAYAWFSGINVDVCWRKSVDSSQLTPSNKVDAPNGLELLPHHVWDDGCQARVDAWRAALPAQ